MNITGVLCNGDGIRNWNRRMDKGRAIMMNSSDSEVQTRKRRVLLIEDDESHAELIRRTFEDSSSVWDIHRVPCISDALQWMAENKMPYLVIADYLLPDGTALDLTKRAMCAEEVGFPLIIITGVGSEQLAVHALKSGVMDYLGKNPDELRDLPWRVERATREWKHIMKQKRVEEELEIYARELERATNELTEFTLIMANYIEGLDELGRECFACIRKTTGRTAELTEDLLTLSHLGRRFIETEQVDLNELIEEINSDLYVRIEEQGGEILAGKLPTISTQRFWMKELLITLIENGLSSKSVERPRVEITCDEREDAYRFKVSENSNGFDEKDLGRIFAASEELSPYDYAGANSRLNICKKIMDKFGSKISVESGPGERTTFCFALPKNNKGRL
ncbi:MAG: response regulator [Methanomicrobia archaeon]|nr:response regulator [Methanomicrobia archaeon]